MTDKRDQWAHDLVAKWPEAPQPSDNLQQASTADDPEQCPKCAGSRVLGEVRGVRCTNCDGRGYVAASATDAGQESNVEHLEKCEGCDRCTGLLEHYMACDKCGTWGQKDADGWQRTADDQFMCERCATPAQATPEGVHDERAAFEAWFSENVYSNPSYLNRRHDDQNTYVSDTVEARWIGWQARAALAASQQAAEPVGEVAHEQNWMTGLIHTYVKWAGEVPSKGTKLYRAAPPQQVDESGLPG